MRVCSCQNFALSKCSHFHLFLILIFIFSAGRGGCAAPEGWQLCCPSNPEADKTRPGGGRNLLLLQLLRAAAGRPVQEAVRRRALQVDLLHDGCRARSQRPGRLHFPAGEWASEGRAELPLRTRHLRSKTRRIGRISRSPPPQILGGSGLKLPIDAISISGATQMLAMASSNEALKYVSYPTQVRIDARAPPRFSAVIMSPGGGVPLLGPLLPERIGS